MAGTSPIVTAGFGSFGSIGLVVTRGYLSGSAPAPPSAGGNIFIMGRGRKRRSAKIGSNLAWMGHSLWLFILRS